MTFNVIQSGRTLFWLLERVWSLEQLCWNRVGCRVWRYRCWRSGDGCRRRVERWCSASAGILPHWLAERDSTSKSIPVVQKNTCRNEVHTSNGTSLFNHCHQNCVADKSYSTVFTTRISQWQCMYLIQWWRGYISPANLPSLVFPRMSFSPQLTKTIVWSDGAFLLLHLQWQSFTLELSNLSYERWNFLFV